MAGREGTEAIGWMDGQNLGGTGTGTHVSGGGGHVSPQGALSVVERRSQVFIKMRTYVPMGGGRMSRPRCATGFREWWGMVSAMSLCVAKIGVEDVAYYIRRRPPMAGGGGVGGSSGLEGGHCGDGGGGPVALAYPHRVGQRYLRGPRDLPQPVATLHRPRGCEPDRGRENLLRQPNRCTADPGEMTPPSPVAIRGSIRSGQPHTRQALPTTYQTLRRHDPSGQHPNTGRRFSAQYSPYVDGHGGRVTVVRYPGSQHG